MAVKTAIKQILQAVSEMEEIFSCYFHTWYQEHSIILQYFASFNTLNVLVLQLHIT